MVSQIVVGGVLHRKETLAEKVFDSVHDGGCDTGSEAPISVHGNVRFDRVDLGADTFRRVENAGQCLRRDVTVVDEFGALGVGLMEFAERRADTDFESNDLAAVTA